MLQRVATAVGASAADRTSHGGNGRTPAAPAGGAPAANGAAHDGTSLAAGAPEKIPEVPIAMPPAGTTTGSAPHATVEPQEAPKGSPALEVSPVPAANASRPGNVTRALVRTGLPRTLVEAVMREVDGGSPLAAALVSALESLPPAPPLPRQLGSLIVVAGPAQAAVDLARTLAGEIGSDPGDVLLASLAPPALLVPSNRRLQYAEDAPSASLYRHRGVALVAVDVAPGTTSASWADHMISSLHPTTVIGLVDAVYKTEDVSAWLDAIGGVDSIALENPEATVSPASILHLEVPVARLGGSPAGAARWAASILDRVLPCE